MTASHLDRIFGVATIGFLLLSSGDSAAGTVEHHQVPGPTRGTRELSVYLPDGYYQSERHYSTLYLFHGYTGTNQTFLGAGYPTFEALIDEIHMDKVADRLITDGVIPPMIIVFPNVNRTVPINDAYRSYVRDQVVAFVDSTYRTIQNRDARIICGHSLGGSDAMFLALAYPELFSSVGMISPYFPSDQPSAAMFDGLDRTAFPLRFWIYVGSNDDFDFIPPGTRQLVSVLADLGIPHEYTEDDADHWVMVRQRIEEFLAYCKPFLSSDEHTVTEPTTWGKLKWLR